LKIFEKNNLSALEFNTQPAARSIYSYSFLVVTFVFLRVETKSFIKVCINQNSELFL